MENDRLTDRNDDENRMIDAFRAIGSAILQTLDLDEVLDVLAEHVLRAGLFRSLMVALVYDDERGIHVVRGLSKYHGARGSTDEPTINYTSFDKHIALDAANIVADVVRKKRIEIVDGWDDRFDDGEGVRSTIERQVSYFIPIIQGEHVIAVLATGSRPEDKAAHVRRIEFMKPLLDQVAVAIHHSAVFRDLKEQIEANRVSEEKFRSLFEHMNSGFALFSARASERVGGDQYLLIDANAEFERMFGARRSDALGEAIEDLEMKVAIDVEAWIKLFDSIRGTREDVNFVFTDEESGRDFDVTLYSPTANHIAAIIRDFTVRKRLENEVVNNRNLKSLGVLAGGIAHEFNNMLAGVMGNIALLKQHFEIHGTGTEVDTNETSEEMYLIANAAEESVAKYLELTEKLMTFSQGGNPQKEQINLEELIRDTLNRLVPGTVRIDYDFPDESLRVHADRGQIVQCIEYIGKNAVEAIEGEGEISVVAKPVVVDDEVHPSLVPGPYVSIALQDTGIGMTPMVLKSAFDPFFTTKPNSQGLGLSIAYSIVQRHGGALLLDSTPGEGTTVIAYLPAEVASSRSTESESGTGKLHVSH